MLRRFVLKKEKDKENYILREGYFFNKWSKNRFKKNKNIIGTITGATGSSKSYDALSLLENYYLNILKRKFPIENVCFSVGAVAKRLNSGELKRGEFLLLEEAGANLGSLDFQNKISKMFVYILQSFRSLNIGLILTLPVLTMLNKQTRQLIHFNFETKTIDYKRKVAKIKPFFHQLNQSSGKSYWKYPRISVDGKVVPIKRLTLSIPSEDLLYEYELRKEKFVKTLTQSFIIEYDKRNIEERIKEGRKLLTPKQKECYRLACKGMFQSQIGEILGMTQPAVSQVLISVKKKGYKVEILTDSDNRISDKAPNPSQRANNTISPSADLKNN